MKSCGKGYWYNQNEGKCEYFGEPDRTTLAIIVLSVFFGLILSYQYPNSLSAIIGLLTIVVAILMVLINRIYLVSLYMVLIAVAIIAYPHIALIGLGFIVTGVGILMAIVEPHTKLKQYVGVFLLIIGIFISLIYYAMMV
jgi:hypothetical protein